MSSRSIQEFPSFPLLEAERFISYYPKLKLPDTVLAYFANLVSWDRAPSQLAAHRRTNKEFYKQYNLPRNDGANQDTARPPIPADLTHPLLCNERPGHQVLLVGAGTGYQSTDHEIMLKHPQLSFTSLDPNVRLTNPMVARYYAYDPIRMANKSDTKYPTILWNGSGIMDVHPSQLIPTIIALAQLSQPSAQLAIDMALLGTTDIPAGTKLRSHIAHPMFDLTTKQPIKSGYDHSIGQYHTEHPDAPYGIFYRDWVDKKGKFGKTFFGITQALLYTIMLASGFTPYTSYDHVNTALQILSNPSDQSYQVLLNALRLDHNQIKHESRLPDSLAFLASVTHTMYYVFTFRPDLTTTANPRSRTIWYKTHEPDKDLFALVK